MLPLALTDDWNLITRPVFQVVNSVPRADGTGSVIRLPVLETPSWRRCFRRARSSQDRGSLAPDPPSSFPLRPLQFGQKKWQLGPGGVFGYLGEHILRRALSAAMVLGRWQRVQADQPDECAILRVVLPASRLVRRHFTEHARSTGMRANGNKLTFPIGLNVAKVKRSVRSP